MLQTQQQQPMMEEDLDDMKTQLVNGVGYLMPPESSIGVTRSHKRQFSQKASYTSGQEIIMDWNTGAEFVNCHRSWLNFTVKSTRDESSWGGRGSALNIIDRIVISTRSGVELSRLERANLYYAKKMRWGCSKEYVQQWGETMGFATNSFETPNPNDPDSPVVPVMVPQTPKIAGTAYSVPLAFLSPFFEGDGKTLLPPQIAAGLRVSITLAQDNTALVDGVGETPRYTVEAISMQTNVTTIVDDWQRQLNEMSASKGLTYAYSEIHTTSSSLGAQQTSVNIQVRKAVARALSAYTVSRVTADINLIEQDSMKSEAFDVARFQWRLGSVYFPQQPIETKVEAFYIAQNATDGGLVDCRTPNAVSFASFQAGTPGDSTLDDGDGITAVSLERSDISLNDVLNISGLPTNNSRALDVDIEFGAGVARTTQLYMSHVKIARAFLENVVVSE